MRRWLLLALLPVALVLLAVGALAARQSRDVEAGAVSDEAAVCPAGAQTDLDRAALIASLDASPLSDMASAEWSTKCYFVGISRFPDLCGCGDLYVLRYLCYDPARMNNGHNGWYYVNYWYCETCCGKWSRGRNDARTWTRCTQWYCRSEWVEWRLWATDDGCRWGQGMLGLDWLSHGTTWFDYFSRDHEVALFPQWSTDVEHGSSGHRVTDSLGGYMPYGPGYGGSYGYTTDTSGCHEPGITDDLTEDNCGHVGQAYVDPLFTTTGFMWCYESPGTWCDPSMTPLDIAWW